MNKRTFFVFAITIGVLTFGSLLSGLFKSPQQEIAYVPPPLFDDYPIEAASFYQGISAAIDFASNPEAETSKTAIAEGAKGGPDFAGRYAVISWGCGTSCQMSAIIDVGTGSIIAYGIPSSYGVKHQIGSRLLIVNPPENLPPATELPYLETDYYVLNGVDLVMVGKYTAAGDELSCAQVVTKGRNLLTGEEREFPSPCRLPFGWEIILPIP